MSKEFNLDDFKKDLKALLKKHNASIGVDIDGDTHCISETIVVYDDSSNKVYNLIKMDCLDHNDL